jgi:hypothetical protein
LVFLLFTIHTQRFFDFSLSVPFFLWIPVFFFFVVVVFFFFFCLRMSGPSGAKKKKADPAWWLPITSSLTNIFGYAEEDRAANSDAAIPPLATRAGAADGGHTAEQGGAARAARPTASDSRNGASAGLDLLNSDDKISMDSADGCLAVASVVLLCGIKTERNQKRARLTLMTLQNLLLIVSTVFVLMTYLKLLSIKSTDVYGSPNGKIQALFYDRQCAEDAGWLAGYDTCGHAMRRSAMADGCALDPSLVEFSAPVPAATPTGNASTPAGTRLQLASHARPRILAGDGPTVLLAESADPGGVPGLSNGDVIRLNLSEPCKEALGLDFLDVFSAPVPAPSRGGQWSAAVYPTPTVVEFTMAGLPYPRPVPAGFSSPLVLHPAASQKLKSASAGVSFGGPDLVLTGGFVGSTNATRAPKIARAISNVKAGGPKFMDEMTIEFSENTTMPMFLADWVESDFFFSGHGFTKTTSAAAVWTDARTLLIRFVEVGGPSTSFLPGARWNLVPDTAFRAASDGSPFAGSFTWIAPSAAPSASTTPTATASVAPTPSATANPGASATPTPSAAASLGPNSAGNGDGTAAGGGGTTFVSPSRIVLVAPKIAALAPFPPASVAFKDTPRITVTSGGGSKSQTTNSTGPGILAANSSAEADAADGAKFSVRWVRGEEDGLLDLTSATALIDVPSGAYVIANGETEASNARAFLALLGFPVPGDDKYFVGVAARIAGLYFPVTWESRQRVSSKGFSVDHTPGQKDHRWEIAFESLTEANAADIATFVADQMGLDPTMVTVIAAEAGGNATDTTTGASESQGTRRQRRAAATAEEEEAAVIRSSRIKLSVRADAQRVDYLASRYGGPDPPATEASMCADGAGGDIFDTYVLVCYFAMALIPLQVIAVIAHGYYEELGCGCITKRIRSSGGAGTKTDSNGLRPGTARIVCELLPRYVPNDSIAKLSVIVKAAAERSGNSEVAAKADIWVDRAKRNKAAVCKEIYEASIGDAKTELAGEIAVWKEKALRYWGWIVKLKAVVPVVITAFLDGTLMLHKVLDPATLVYDGDNIPVDWVQITMLCPMVVLTMALFYALFAWIARRVLAKEEKRDEKERKDAARLAAMTEVERAAELQRRRDEIRKMLEKKHKKDKKPVTEKMIDQHKPSTPICTSGAWRVTAKGCLWTGVLFFVIGTLFGFYVKAVTAFAALTGKFGAGVQILLNLTDLAYVLLSVHLVVPKLVRPPDV